MKRWMVLAIRLWGCRSLAEVIQVLTRRQTVRYLGALPVMIALLERLKVRQIINHYCPTQSPVDQGAVALVLVLNRLMAPRPVYQIVTWLSTTLIANAQTDVAELMDEMISPIELHPTAPDLYQKTEVQVDTPRYG